VIFRMAARDARRRTTVIFRMPARAARAAAQALGRGGGVQGRATGLLGLPWLRQPQSLLAHAEHCRARCEALVQEAVAMPASAAVLHKVDQISESLCSALDVASLVSAVHPDPEWGEAAASASTMVGTTMARLNTDRQITTSSSTTIYPAVCTH